MVIIKGIQLKNIRNFRGMEFEGYAANIYMDGKKIGDVVESGNGGDVDVNINSTSKEEFFKRVENDEAAFCGEYLDLVTLEKEYKRAAKKYPSSKISLIALYTELFEGCSEVSFSGSLYLTSNGNEETTIEQIKKNGVKAEYRVFKGLEDFTIN